MYKRLQWRRRQRGQKGNEGRKGCKKIPNRCNRPLKPPAHLSSAPTHTGTHTHTHALTPSLGQKEAQGIKNKEACVWKNSLKFK